MPANVRNHMTTEKTQPGNRRSENKPGKSGFGKKRTEPDLSFERALASGRADAREGKSASAAETAAINADQAADIVIGVDEVGRGSLAGPVMLGACAIGREMIFSKEKIAEGIADSKLLTERRREELFEILKQRVPAYAVGQSDNREIDNMGISHCMGLAALRAIAEAEKILIEKNLLPAPDSVFESGGCCESASSCESVVKFVRKPVIAVILDGPTDYISPVQMQLDVPEMPYSVRVYTRVKADMTCASVASASVIAKVTRDRHMVSLAGSSPRFEPYQWQKNKGYGSAAHREAIAKYGPCEYHRKSWNLTRSKR